MMEALSGPKSGFADIAAVFSFMKALDPRSVVRDSEFQMAAGATGVFDKLFNLGEQVEKGLILPKDARPQLAELATRLVKHWENAYKAQRTNAERQIKYHSQENAEEDILNFLGDIKTLPDFSGKTPDTTVKVPEPTFDGTGMFPSIQYQPSVSGQDQLLQNFNKLMQIDYSAMGQN